MEKRAGGGGGLLQHAKRCTQVPEHEGSWYMRISHTPLASKVKQALVVVNCIKLHLTALIVSQILGKSFLVKIKTGKPWDNDFLFTSNGNYQSTRREIEVKVRNEET